ncbi:hypothetical protein BOX15_Mlig003050g2, partial [Macrostomum lignano]
LALQMVLAVLIHYSRGGKVVPLYWQIFIDLSESVGPADSSATASTAVAAGEVEVDDDESRHQANDDSASSATAAAGADSDNFGGGGGNDAASRIDTGSVVSFGSQSTALSAATTGASTAAGHIGRSSASRIPRRCPLLSLAKRVDAEWQLVRASQALASASANQGAQHAEAEDLRRLAADSMPDFCRGVCPAVAGMNRRLPRELETGNAVWLAAASLCLTLVCSPEENVSLAGHCLLSLAKRLHSLTRFLLQPMQLIYRAETVRLTVNGALTAHGVALPYCTSRANKARDRLTEIGAKSCKF